MTAASVPVDAPPPVEKRSFPNCQSCGWRPEIKIVVDGLAPLQRLARLAAAAGQPLTRRELMTVVADYKCKKCRAISLVHLGDLLRN